MSKKIKFSIAISMVVFVMALGIVTLILALVPVGSNNVVNLPDEVYIYTNSVGKYKGKLAYRRGFDSKDDAKINKIFDLFNAGLQQKALNAIFRGELGDTLEFVDNHANSNGNNNINKYKDDEENITIVFSYKNKQNVPNATANYKGFSYLCFTVTANTEWRDIIFGLPTSVSDGDSEETSNIISYQYSLNGKMNTAELYKYAYSLIEVFLD